MSRLKVEIGTRFQGFFAGVLNMILCTRIARNLGIGLKIECSSRMGRFWISFGSLGVSYGQKTSLWAHLRAEYSNEESTFKF